MPLLDKEFTKSRLTNNQLNKKKADGTDYVDLQSTPYRWTHGATDFHLGDGLLVHNNTGYEI